MKIEIIIYIVLICISNAYLRILHSKKNGCFYGKGNIPIPEKLKTEILNLHYLATPDGTHRCLVCFFLFLLFLGC